MSDELFQSWAILELMGHRRLAGLVQEVQIGGASFLRIDVPETAENARQSDHFTTQFYAPSAVYCITPTTEAIARRVASNIGFEPVHPYDLRQSVPSRQLQAGNGDRRDWPEDDDDGR